MTITDRMEFSGRLAESERLIWCDWFQRHGADPHDIPLDSWVERHEDTYRLVYEAYARDEKGNRYLNPERTAAVREIRVVQLEGRPLPFPTLSASVGG